MTTATTETVRESQVQKIDTAYLAGCAAQERGDEAAYRRANDDLTALMIESTLPELAAWSAMDAGRETP